MCFNKSAHKLCGYQSALALGESVWWMQSTINICRIVEVLAKSQLHPLHSPSLFVCLSEWRCYLRRSARKKTVTRKICDKLKTSSGFTSLYHYSSHSAYLKILVCFKKSTSIKTSDFSDGPCKIFNRE